MNDLSLLYLIAVIVLTGVSQVLLKIGAKQAKNHVSIFINPYTLTAYSLYLLTTLLTVYALRNIPLNMFYASTSLKFIFVAFLSRIVIGEKLNNRKLVAVSLIVVGVVVFSSN
jgi:drug/metabolite transporter (DMT)-like permease